MHTPPLVIALGGNAISQKGEEGNIDQQFGRARQSCGVLADLIAAGHQVVITHGNGPQVGNILRRVELSAREVYPIPLYLCVADSQAGMGFMLTQCLNNALDARGIKRQSTTIITSVLVDPNDPGFKNPTKPIGKFLPEAEAKLLMEEFHWPIQQFGKGEFRMVVPSPQPLRIIEMELIRKLVADGEILVCGGGGGIPVVPGPEGLRGVDAVVDKDRTTALLAAELGAQTLVIATAVDRVALHYGKPNEQWLDTLTIADARRLLAEGHFPAGTMGPKVEAALDFLERTPAKNPQTIITRLESVAEALAGTTGTRVVRG